MLKELLEKKCNEIDSKAENDKAGIKYLTSLVEQDYKRFSMVFSETDPEKLYSNVEKLISSLTKEYSRTNGMWSFAGPASHPGVDLGWAKFELWFKSSNQYGLWLTEEGKKVIDEYRKAKGLYSLDEQLKINQEKVDKIRNAV